MNKNYLRKKYLLIRKKIKDKDDKSNVIFNKIINLDEYNNSKVIALYHSLKSEVNTINLINYSLNNKKIVLLPKVENDHIDFIEIENINNLKKSNFGIMEVDDGIKYNKSNIDLIIVPLVCFDEKLNRIGFGKGYYDKYLSNYCGKKISIAFSEQYTNEKIDIESNDVKLDIIVTDTNIYS